MKILTLNEYSLIDFVNLVNKVFQDYTVPVNWNVVNFEMDVRENSISLEDSFIFLKGQKPVGFIVNSIRHERARIDAMGVIREERGTGTASFILEHATNYLKWKGIQNISLEVITKDLRAYKFYEKHGFREIRKLHLMVKKDMDFEPVEFRAIKVEPRYVYTVSLNLQLSGRKPNWQREPVTLLLADGRYKYVRLITKNTEGYLVWGKNEDNSVYIVDMGTKEEWNELAKCALNFLNTETNCSIVSATSVPEDDPLFNALKENGFESILTQSEMRKKL
ncbi:GCN5 family acetyltransferase [Thermosipho melanesiensis]|uniref:GCN5-related N-acetyltransferase n=2 Tax=Thermosipho melanesiensis TaxID=46541 RepID=A6LKE5_THEM4|nr:GNAT family N-acetyltransferase [Thermosipho melanesiensis]ABR30396.1 GCN5-related N-acetyltransferase [Thermosipho melanesiensis BI429]APT73558.1 acetyltransferase [Thermosipho melanesiensis]OOC37509.1 GCN5 family acetyltransferase [Thermosipho melanesiensis]OOC39548.1 GCN5 family acetyltransferase [Thermosipho melanesiensis]OOC39565.1 GCN5 family acetyltransferase [Thermosipho melanesiensis]